MQLARMEGLGRTSNMGIADTDVVSVSNSARGAACFSCRARPKATKSTSCKRTLRSGDASAAGTT